MNTALLVGEEETSIQDSIDEHLMDCEAAGLAAATIYTKRVTLMGMARWCADQEFLHMQQVTTTVSKRYLIHLAKTPSSKTGRPRSPTTVRSAAVIIKTWLRWAYDQRQIDAERLYGYKIPKAKNPSVYKANQQELQSVFGIVDDYWDIEKHPEIRFWPKASHRFFSVRMKAIIAIQVSTALRIGETLSMRLSSYDRTKKLLYVTQTKNGENRDVPVGRDLAHVLDEWLRIRPKKCPSDYLIVTETGTKLDRRACTRQYQRYLQFARDQGLELPRITMHSWRHVALHAMAQVNPEHARKIAGHKSANTTLRYLHTTTEDLRETHDKADPLAGILVDTRSRKAQAQPRQRKIFTPK